MFIYNIIIIIIIDLIIKPEIEKNTQIVNKYDNIIISNDVYILLCLIIIIYNNLYNNKNILINKILNNRFHYNEKYNLMYKNMNLNLNKIYYKIEDINYKKELKMYILINNINKYSNIDIIGIFVLLFVIIINFI